jgi:hypothetical protein
MDGAGYVGGVCQAIQGALLPVGAQILRKKPPHKVKKNNSFILIFFNALDAEQGHERQEPGVP